MRALCSLTMLIVTALAATNASADGLLHKLPEDGAWAEFELSGGERDVDDPTDFKKGAGTLRLSSVGSTIEGGEKCRWIELDAQIVQDFEAGQRVRQTNYLTKVLVPESHLTKGGSPGEHVIRGWRKRSTPDREGEVRKLRELDSRPHPGDIEAVLLAGPSKDVKKLEPKLIETRLGKLKCEGLTGTFQVKQPGPDGPRDLTGTVEVWLHEKAPFGVVAFNITTKEPNGDIITFNLELTEAGTTALSQLPKHK